MRQRRTLWLGLALGLAACGTDPAPMDDAGTDAGARDAGAPPAPWPGELASTETLGDRRGRRIARATIHVHSPLSHDACDGEGWGDGELLDPTCLEHFRAAFCALRVDAAMITDHAPHINEVPFEQGLWIEGDDEPVMDGDAIVANRMACPDGHRVLLTVGSENTLMPIALTAHPDAADADALESLYDANTPESRAAFRAAGGLVWQAHTEGRSLEQLRESELDGLELYNLHANVDPGIREDDLGLDPAGFFADLLLFTRPQLGLAPDLAALAFFEENRVALDRWDTLLAEGLRIAGSGGCDAHENVFPMELSDGERADSYRRMMFWIENHVLVDDVTPDGIREALAAGRLYVTAEVFGSPVGFDFTADDTFEMGDVAPVGATLRVVAPRLPDGWPSEPAPELSVHLFRAEAGGGVEVASTAGGDLEHVADVAGAYRAEVRMVPNHARPSLGSRADSLIREITWVWSNPIFVE